MRPRSRKPGQADEGVQKLKVSLKGGPEDRDVYITLANLYTRLQSLSRSRGSDRKGRRSSPLSRKKTGV